MIVAKYFVDVLTPIQISFLRWFFAMIFLLPFTIKSIWQYKKELIESWQIVLWSSMLGVILVNLFVYIAGYSATAIDMSLIGSTGPILLVVLSAIFLKTELSKRQIFGFLVTIIGVLMIIFKGKFVDIPFVIGDIWMIAMSVCFAIYGLITAMRPKLLPQIVLLSTTIVVAVIILAPLFWNSLKYHPIDNLSTVDWLVMLYMGLFNSVIAYFCWNIAIEKLGSVKSGIIYCLLPLFTTIEAALFLGEKIYASQIYGGLVVLLGVFLTIVKSHFKISIKIERA